MSGQKFEIGQEVKASASIYAKFPAIIRDTRMHRGQIQYQVEFRTTYKTWRYEEEIEDVKHESLHKEK